MKTAFRARSSRTISRQRTEAEFRKRAAFRVSKRTHPQRDRLDVPFDWEKSNTFSAGEPEATCDRTHSAAGALPESRFDECFTHRSGRHSRFDECYAHRRARPADLTNVSHFRGPGRHLSRFGPRVGVGAHLPPSIIPMSVGQTSPPPRSHRTIVYSTFRIFQRNHAFEGYGRGRRIPGAKMEGPKVCSPITGWDLLGTQDPGTRSTPTPLPGRLHLALVGREDGSLHSNSLK